METSTTDVHLHLDSAVYSCASILMQTLASKPKMSPTTSKEDTTSPIESENNHVHGTVGFYRNGIENGKSLEKTTVAGSNISDEQVSSPTKTAGISSTQSESSEVLNLAESNRQGISLHCFAKSDDDNTTPVTPTTKRTADYTPGRVVKTPTFAPDGVKRRNKRRPRRQRADTPHPNGELDSVTTSPETTPEKPSKPRRKRRYPKKVRANVTSGSSTSSPESEIAIGAESPLAHKSKSFTESCEKVDSRSGQSLEVSAVEPSVVTSVEVSLDKSVEKPLSPVEALTVEIDYPSFQTTAILDFEPDFPQTQSAPPDVSTKSQDTPKDVPKKKKFNRFVRRGRRIRRLRQRKPKPLVKEGTRPALSILFEKYGAEFSNEKRPYLQLSVLEAAAQQQKSDIDRDDLRVEFIKAFQSDYEHAWPGREVMISPIDQYFALNDGTVKTFQYNPRREATVEFVRLSLQAGWIKELPVWDITNWDQSLKEFEKIWSDKTARQERGKFKEACFYEFDQVYPPKFVN